MPAIAHRKKTPKAKQAGGKSKSKSKMANPRGTPLKSQFALELRHRLNLNQSAFARLLPVSVRTLATLESGAPPTDVVARRLTEIDRLTTALAEVIKKESLGRWLQTPNEAFDGLKPIEVIDRGESDRIWSMIYFLRSGVAS
jgi:DNA-binding transcriptional regulator YiaG